MLGYGRLCSAIGGVVRTIMMVRKFAALCYWEMQWQIARRSVMVGSRWQWVANVAPCFWGMQLQIARRRVMVGPRWREVEMPVGK